jgi:hypothetical protein
MHVKALKPELGQALADASATDVLASKPLGVYQTWVTPEALAQIASLAAVTKVTPPTHGFAQPPIH